MRTGTRVTYPDPAFSGLEPPPEIRESFSRRRPAGLPEHTLAGSDLRLLWDSARFLHHCIPYGCEFMRRMHHPFHEVLACLYLSDTHEAIAYNSHFRGEKSSALAHLPGIARTAQQLAAARVLLAHNPVWYPDSRLPDLGLASRQLRMAGVELHDFLLIRPDTTLSLRAHGAL